MSLLYYKQKLLSTSVDGRKSSSLQKFCRILSTAGQITIHRVKSDRKTAKNFSAKKPKNRQNLCVFCCPLRLAIARRGVCRYAWRLPVAVFAATPAVCPVRCVATPGDCPSRCVARLAIACRFFVFRTRRPKKLPEAARKRLRATLIYKIVLLERNVFIKSAGKMLSNRTFLRRRAGQGDRVPERAFPVF